MRLSNSNKLGALTRYSTLDFQHSYFVAKVSFPLDQASFFFIGKSRTRLPVAAKIALQIAGAIGGTPGSPTPAGGASL
jgi:hypothetical protein